MDRIERIRNDFYVLRDAYPSLKLFKLETGYSVSGYVDFKADEVSGISMDGEYLIEIHVHDDYPDTIPLAYPGDDSIDVKYHRLDNDALCLGTPSDQWHRYSMEQTLLGFVRNLLIPYLAIHHHHNTHGSTNKYSRSHGPQGIKEAYEERFGISSINCLVHLMDYSISVMPKIYHRRICPCGSGLRISKCKNHHEVLLFLVSLPKYIIESELKPLRKLLSQDEQDNNAGDELSKRVI